MTFKKPLKLGNALRILVLLCGISPYSASAAEKSGERDLPFEAWSRGKTVKSRELGVGMDGKRHRERIVKTDFKYPNLLMEESYENDGAAQRVIKRRGIIADHVIVRLSTGKNKTDLEAALKPLGFSIRKKMFTPRLFLVALDTPSLEIRKTAKWLGRRLKGIIDYAEPDGLKITNGVPNDTQFAQQYCHQNTGQTGGINGADMQTVDAWQITTGSRNVLVGVIDTGVMFDHPDLASNVWSNPGETGLDVNGNDKRFNGIDDDGNSLVDDWHGWDFADDDNNPTDGNVYAHGTHVAGIIGASGNNGTGVTGVCWNVSLLPIKIFKTGVFAGTQSDEADGIRYANLMRCRITNNSYGGDSSPSQAVSDAITAADNAGALFVTAAGNSGLNVDVQSQSMTFYTSTHKNMIVAANTTHADTLYSGSNYGLTRVHVGAPGTNILSTVKSTSGLPVYAQATGTSMAGPQVAGIAALIWSAVPTLTHDQVKAIILETVDPLASLTGKVSTGGRVNAYKAVSKALTFAGVPAVTLTSPVEGTRINPGSALLLKATATDLDGSIAKVRYLANGTQIGQSTLAPSYQVTSPALATGYYSVIAEATDNSGKIAVSSTTSLFVTNAPTASISSPATGSNVNLPATININSAAADTDGTIARVELWMNGDKLSQLTTGPYNFTYTPQYGGIYKFKTIVVDNIGASTASAEVTVTAADSLSNALIAHYSFDDGTANDSSGLAHHGTIGGAVSEPGGAKGAGMRFNGVADYVQIADANNPQDFLHGKVKKLDRRSVSLWFKAETTTGTRILYEEGKAGWELGIGIKNNNLYLGYDNRLYTSAFTPFTAVGTWNHVLATLNNGVYKLYLNNLLVINASNFMGSVTIENDNTADAAGVGARRGTAVNALNAAGNFQGVIDEVKIWDRDLTVAEVNTIFTTTMQVAPNVKPVAAFTSTVPGSVVPVSVSFDAGTSTDSDGTLVSYQWNFGDGTTGSGKTVTHTYTTGGPSHVTLTITDDDGATATVAKGLFFLAPTWSFSTLPSAPVSMLGNALPFDGPSAGITASRFQQVFAASGFTGVAAPKLITHLTFRPRRNSAVAYSATIPNVQIRMSTTAKAPNALSTTFSANVGTDVVLVHSGALALRSAASDAGGGAKDFDIVVTLQTPFLYDPTKGNLLLEIQNFGEILTTSLEHANDSGDTVSRLVSSTSATATTGTQDTLGAITRFVMKPAGTSPTNAAPTVNAGVDTSATVGVAKAMAATVGDDGLPTPANLTQNWTKVSGAGTVTFSSATALNPAATFSASGTYVLRLTASDGALSTTDDVQVAVIAANTAPVVNAGVDTTATVGVAKTMAATVSDDGLPTPANLIKSWSKISGAGTVTFSSATALNPTATFGAVGTYVLRLIASDGALSASNDVQVVVSAANTAPVVNAGSDTTATVGSAKTMGAMVSDDGLPTPANLTKSWSKSSGPGTVTFSNTTVLNPNVTFGSAGTYVLRVTANDGVLSTSDDVQVIVSNPGSEGSRLTPGSANNTFIFSWDGLSGRTYFLQQSTDLTIWTYSPTIWSGAGQRIIRNFTSTEKNLYLRLRFSDITTANPATADFDGDGVNNNQELLNGTDPFSASGQPIAATPPLGFITLDIAAGTAAGPVTSVLSLPLQDVAEGVVGQTNGKITGVTANTISNSAAGWTPGALSAASTPYQIKITSGAALGRTFLLATGSASPNTATKVTLDPADAAQTNLTTLGIATGASGDTYELLPCDTLASLFGTPATTGILGATSAAGADTVQLFVSGAWRLYYYNTISNDWRRAGANTVSNDLPIRADAAVMVSRLAVSALPLKLIGKVPAISRKAVIANSGVTFLAAGWPVDLTLSTSGINSTPGWVSSSDPNAADVVQMMVGGVWRQYFHNGTNWIRAGANTVSNSVPLTKGTGAVILKRGTATGTSTFAQSIPYNLSL